MNELIDVQHNWSSLSRHLLATVSAVALMASTGASGTAFAEDDADRPTVWIELGGQLERMNDQQEAFSPPFMASIKQANLLSALNVQNPSTYSIGGEGSISFQPNDSDWVFSAAVRYGRSQSARHYHQQTPNAKIPMQLSYLGTYPGYAAAKYPSSHVKFADGKASQSESHLVLDFQAGKDVGIGILDKQGASVLSAGVRFAQFNSKTAVSLHAEPDVRYPTKPITSVSGFLAFKYAPIHFHDYAATANIQRNFSGAGPSLTWKASLPFAGDTGGTELTFDWGANAALLFGRQRASGHHQTVTKTYNFNHWKNRNKFGGQPGAWLYQGGGFAYGVDGNVGPNAQHTNVANFNRERAVTVPNFGGFAGVSLKWPNAKISLGYRADFFFGAMDGGIDMAKNENRGFYGPFASVSVGIGG